MAQFVKSVLRGFIRPMDRAEVWDAETGEFNSGGTRLGPLHSAGPTPGVPDPQQASELVLVATGAQSANKELRVAVQRSGMPDDRGTFRWCYEGDSDWRGWEPPVTISAWEPLDWTNATARNWQHPHALTLDDDAVVVVAEYDAGTDYVTACWRRDPDLGTWARGTDLTAAASTTAAYPCLMLVPNGTTTRLVCFYWIIADGMANVGFSYADDQGTTWTEGARAVLPEAFDIADWTPKRLRAAYLDGQVLLFASVQALDTALATEDILVQYASTDLGASFVEVYRQDTASDAGGAYPDLVVHNGAFLLVAEAITSVADYPVAVRLGSAFTSLGSVTPVTVSIEALADGTDFLTGGDLCVVLDDSGALYVTGRRFSDKVWTTYQSRDGGETWDPIGANSLGSPGHGTWWRADSGTYPADACAVFQQGRMLVIHSHVSSPGVYDESLSCAYLGGYTTYTLPALTTDELDASRVSYTTTWLPFDEPDDMGWTATVTGAPTADISSGRLRIQAASGEGLWYHQTPTGSLAGGILVDVVAEGDASTAFVQVRHYAAGEGYELEVRVTPTAVDLWDAVANIQRDSYSITGEVQIRVILVNDQMVVRVRAYSNGSDRVWTELTGALADDAGATFTSSRVRFGVPSSGVVTRDVYFRFMAWVTDDGSDPFSGYDLPTWLDTYANPASLHGRALASVPTYVDDGLRLSAADGPGFSGETWNIDTDSTHPLPRVLPHIEPSPQRGWRSGDVADFAAGTAYLHLAFRVDADGEGGFLGEDCALENDLLGVYLDELNCAQVEIDLYYGGAWHHATTTSGVAFSAVRTGNTLRPASALAAGNKVRFGELNGAMVGIYTASYTVTGWTGTLGGNTEGTTRTDTVTKFPTFVLQGADNTLSNTPNVALWPRRHLAIIHPSGFSRSIQGFRLKIPVTGPTVYPGRPASGYYEVGKVAFGPVLVFGHDYSWNRILSVEAGVELAERRDGSRSARVVAPPRVKLEIGWTEVDTTDYYGATAPDYLLGSANSGAAAVAFRHDAPNLLQDLARDIDGPATPLVFLPSIAYDATSGSSGDADAAWTNFATGALYGRLTSPIRTEQILGEELADEVLRVSSLEFTTER